MADPTTLVTPPARTLGDLPGPPGLPLVGSMFSLRPLTVHQGIERWCREYGPLFRFVSARNEFLVVAGHEQVTAILRDRPDGWRRAPHTSRIGREMGLPQGVFSSEGERWRAQRRMVMGGLDPGRVRGYVPALLRVAARLRTRWQAAAREGRALELQPELMRFTVDTVAGLAFGADVNTIESDGVVIQQHLDKIFPALYRRTLALVPYWRWLRLPADRALDRSVVEVRRVIAAFIAEARARLAADPARRAEPPNLLEAMVVAADEPGSGIDDDQVAGNVLTMLLAGEDTTANTLAWALHLLHRHPAALQRAVDEVLALGVPLEELTPEHLARLDWIEACLHETMRLEPVAPFTVMQALRDTRVGDIAVPAGTLAWLVLRHDSVADTHFERASAFEPERWLDERAAGRAKRISMPFGAGPRVCPGRYLALTEMKLLLAMLLGGFELLSVATPDGGAPAERMSFTMVPTGLRMRLALRAAG